jgi:hypothetical protein
MLLMVFCINRDALFSRNNLFPITFFAVHKDSFSAKKYFKKYHACAPLSCTKAVSLIKYESAMTTKNLVIVATVKPDRLHHDRQLRV